MTVTRDEHLAWCKRRARGRSSAEQLTQSFYDRFKRIVINWRLLFMWVAMVLGRKQARNHALVQHPRSMPSEVRGP
jgi:hypothetical protein